MDTNNPPLLGVLHDVQRAKRATGRTTRMMKEAIRLSKEGRQVLVIADTMATAGIFRLLIKRLDPDIESRHWLRIKFTDPDALGHRFDWTRLQLRDDRDNTAVLIDHFTLQPVIAQMIEAIHRFDEPAPGNKPIIPQPTPFTPSF